MKLTGTRLFLHKVTTTFLVYAVPLSWSSEEGTGSRAVRERTASYKKKSSTVRERTASYQKQNPEQSERKLQAAKKQKQNPEQSERELQATKKIKYRQRENCKLPKTKSRTVREKIECYQKNKKTKQNPEQSERKLQAIKKKNQEP